MEALSSSFSIVSFFAPKSLFCVDNFSVLVNITLNIFPIYTNVPNTKSVICRKLVRHETSCSLVPGSGWTLVICNGFAWKLPINAAASMLVVRGYASLSSHGDLDNDWLRILNQNPHIYIELMGESPKPTPSAIADTEFQNSALQATSICHMYWSTYFHIWIFCTDVLI